MLKNGEPIPVDLAEKIINAVRNSITTTAQDGHTFASAPLNGGIAVLVDNRAAYWVAKNSVVYAANDEAKEWSLGVSRLTRSDISYQSVQDAVSLSA